MKLRNRILAWSALLACLTAACQLNAQQYQLGKIIGNVRLAHGDFPAQPVMISLEMRGSPIATTYNDDRGTFGFYNLVANQYTVTVNDDAYEPFSAATEVNPATAPTNFIQITLTPRPNAKKDPIPGRVGGSNPYLVDPADYYRKFPKKTLKEYEKGVDADHKGNADDAVEHYRRALEYSPDFYPAHNNLGTIYLGRQNFEGAQAQFEAAVKSNQNDGQAYFNLANVLFLTQHYDDAERQVDQGLQRRPDSAFGKFLQGSVYSRSGHPDLAERSLQSALQLDPKMSEAHLQLVNLYLQQKRSADAITQLETYLKAFPDSPFSPKARDLLKRLQSQTDHAPK
jgi:tetratricopeptide (TPR) repeat protein